MSNAKFRSILAVAVVLQLLWGLARAGSKERFQEREKAIREECAAERKRLGLDPETLRKKYPTPEEMLCRVTRVVPGGTAEVVVKGKFLPGTKFLFDNDKVEVVKEAATASEYRASIKAGQSAGPDYSRLVSFQPVTSRTTYCSAVYIGGRYAWDLTADNGWRIKLTPVKEPSGGEGEHLAATYRAEFYRPGESKPFEVREASLGPGGDVESAEYSGSISQEAESSKLLAAMEKSSGKRGDQPDPRRKKELEDEMARLTKKMQNLAQLSEADQKKLMDRFQEVIKEINEATLGKSTMEAAEKMQKEEEEFGCRSMNLWAKDGRLEGNMGCGAKVGKEGSLGRLELKGTMKYLGP